MEAQKSKMRFFTREWHAGELPQREVRERTRTYFEVHLPAALARFPRRLQALVGAAGGTLLNLHDARIERLDVRREGAEVRARFRGGDRQSGYWILGVLYLGVTLTDEGERDLERVARTRDSAILYDEFDVAADGRAVHRVLMWPYDEFELTFVDVEWSRVAGPQ